MFNFRQMTVSARQWFLTGQFVISLVVGGGLALWITSTLGNKIATLLHTDIPGSKYTALIDMSHDGIRGLVYGSILAAEAKQNEKLGHFKSELSEHKASFKEDFEKLRKAGFSDEINQALTAAESKMDSYAAISEEILSLASDQKVDEAKSKLAAFESSFVELREVLDKNTQAIYQITSASEAQADELKSQARIYNVIVTCISLVISLILSVWLIRNLNRHLKHLVEGIKEQSERMHVVANQFASDSSGLASTTTQQTSALQETAATLDEISAMVKRTEENSKSLQETSEESQKAAEHGKRAIGEMTESIASIENSFDQITNQVNNSNAQFTELVEVIKNIGAKTKVINDIVFQTKLLSFNASVEAARAGEHGKGFAVVAQEIGNLAQMSGNAAQDISDMLTSSVSKVESIVNENRSRIESLMADGKDRVTKGTQVSKETEASLHEILQHSTQVNQMINEINASIFEQSRGVREIVNAVTMMNTATAEIARASESGAAGSKELLKQTESLSHFVNDLEALIKRRDTADSASPMEALPDRKLQKAKAPASAKAANNPPPAPANSSKASPTSPSPASKSVGEALPFVMKKTLKKEAPVAPVASPLAKTGTDGGIPSSNDPRFEEI